MEEEVFVDKEFSVFTLKHDKVELVIFNKKNGKFQGEVVKVIERKQNTFVGLLQETKGFGFLIPNGNIPFDIFIPNSEINRW